MWKLQQKMYSVWFHILINLLLPASVELFDGTELIKELLINQPWHKEKFVV